MKRSIVATETQIGLLRHSVEIAVTEIQIEIARAQRIKLNREVAREVGSLPARRVSQDDALDKEIEGNQRMILALKAVLSDLL